MMKSSNTIDAARTTEHPVLLFDGVCNLCSQSVQFIIERDPAARFRFASLQSEVAEQMLSDTDLTGESLKSVVLIENGQVYTRSDAALRAARHLSGLWPALYALRIVPRPWRDAVYNWIARNRYRWFGEKDSCWLPTPDLRDRFLDN